MAWPAQLRPALSTVGFATELRDLLARCTERGVDPVALQRIGRLPGRPEWLAAGQFAQAYEQIMLLRSAVGMAAPQATVPALGAAELVGAALEAFATDADLLAAERGRIKLLLVDDAQHLDPQAARLVRVLAAGAELTVIAGDPNQSVFGYRGADPALLRGDERPVDHADAVAPLRAGRRRRRSPGSRAGCPAPTRPATSPVPSDRPGSVTVRIAASPHAESALIADALRRAHLVDGVPWSQMAVIVRSVPRAGCGAGARADRGRGAGGPAAVDAPLAEQPAVRALLTVLDATADGLDGDRALSLLTGPIGRVDPVSLRQLRRALRRADWQPAPPREFADLLVEALDDGHPPDSPASTGPAAAPGARGAGGRAAQRRRRAGSALHAVAGLASLRSAAALAGRQRARRPRRRAGRPRPRRRDRAVRRRRAVRRPHRGRVAARPGRPRRGAGAARDAAATERPAADAVAVLSAHAALGREWEFVVIAGLQEGLWPNTIPRGGVLGTQQLVDVLDGVATQPSVDCRPGRRCWPRNAGC